MSNRRAEAHQIPRQVYCGDLSPARGEAACQGSSAGSQVDDKGVLHVDTDLDQGVKELRRKPGAVAQIVVGGPAEVGRCHGQTDYVEVVARGCWLLA